MGRYTNCGSSKFNWYEKKDLQTQLADLKLDISGDGEKVIKQSPEAGAKVKEGSKLEFTSGIKGNLVRFMVQLVEVSSL